MLTGFPFRYLLINLSRIDLAHAHVTSVLLRIQPINRTTRSFAFSHGKQQGVAAASGSRNGSQSANSAARLIGHFGVEVAHVLNDRV